MAESNREEVERTCRGGKIGLMTMMNRIVFVRMSYWILIHVQNTHVHSERFSLEGEEDGEPFAPTLHNQTRLVRHHPILPVVE